MRVIYFSKRNLIFLSLGVFVLITALVFAASSGMDSVVQVTAVKKEIPIYSVDTRENKVALTFDCAWAATDIPEILDILKQYDAKATFFVVGQWAEKNPDAVRQIDQAGHEIGNHGYSHLRMGALGEAKIREEIQKATDVVFDITGKKMDLFRAPYGDYTNRTISIARQMGYHSIQWDVDSLDWKENISKDEIIRRVVEKADKGSIILMHNDTKHTVSALPTILQKLRENGFSVVTVSELILKDDYELDNTGRQYKKK